MWDVGVQIDICSQAVQIPIWMFRCRPVGRHVADPDVIQIANLYRQLLSQAPFAREKSGWKK